MTTQTTMINTPGQNTYTAPATLVGGQVTLVMYGAMGDGEPAQYSGPITTPPWPGVTTTGGKSGRIDATVSLNAGGTLVCWVGDAAGHGYHPGGTGSAAGGGGQTGFRGGGSSAILTGAATPARLLEAAGGGGAGGYAYAIASGNGAPGFGHAHGGIGGKVFGAGYNGGVTPRTPACFGGGGGGGGGVQGNGANALNTHTGHGGTAPGGGGDNGLNQTNVAGGGGGGAGGTSYVQVGTGVVTAKFYDGAGTTTLGSMSISAKVADPPLAPTLVTPYNGIYVDCTKAVTVGWVYNKGGDGGYQNAYALRVKLDSGAYQYWDATNQVFQPAPVWNSYVNNQPPYQIQVGQTQPVPTLRVTIPANAIANGHTVSWSIATAESTYNLQGPFATDRTFISGTTIKWQLVDPVTNEAYSFAINPNTGGSLSRQKNVSSYATTADDSVMVLYEGADSPQPVEISGTLLTQAQYSAMLYWYSKRRQVLLIDDLGRNIWVYFVHWDPQRKWTVQSPWRHDWSAQFYVIGPQAVTAR